jgi:hypothetical protein
MHAKARGIRPNYTPQAGAEHCPACWVLTRSVQPIRTEPHHNGHRVFAAVCDACGLFLPI